MICLRKVHFDELKTTSAFAESNLSVIGDEEHTTESNLDKYSSESSGVGAIPDPDPDPRS